MIFLLAFDRDLVKRDRPDQHTPFHTLDLTLHELPSDVELQVGIDDRSGSMGAELYLRYEMRAMRDKRTARIINTTVASVNAR